QRVPEKPIAITPNGVDVDYFTPQTSTPRDPDNAVFMGDYKYFPNTDAALYFIREIMPRIRAERPNFTLTLLGKDPTPELLEIGTTAGSGVKVEGLVEDTRPYLLRAALFVCPLRSGSGTRFKLLESLACGLPVVSTTLGAEGLDATNDRHMIIADTPDAFASAVIRLLKYPDEAMRLGRYGRNWVNERHSWRRSAALLADAYHRVIGSEDMTIPSPMGRRARRRDGT
ncbi:MAG TPA: glycosyltransferase family 4 protein, partial [Aggregatilineales bacterium]|nr:glycosyltransferase family 4 protein [Aggregatilineales bacterium]